MKDCSLIRYKYSNSWMMSLASPQSLILPPVMGEEFALQNLHQPEGSAEGRKRWPWGQWLQLECFSSYTNTTNEHFLCQRGYKTGNTPSWTNPSCAITAGTHKTLDTYMKPQGLDICFYPRWKDDASPIALPSSSHYFLLHTFTGTHFESNLLSGSTVMHGKEPWGCAIDVPSAGNEGSGGAGEGGSQRQLNTQKQN